MSFELFGLLSRIRIGRQAPILQTAAERQFLFPAIGAIIGLLVFLVACLLTLIVADILGSLLTAILIYMFLYFLTGIIHIEGMADFGDGLITSGDIHKKRSAMKDVSLGAGGTFLMILDIILLILLLSNLVETAFEPIYEFWVLRPVLILGIIVAEVSAKLSMITAMRVGPSSHEGMGSVFVHCATNTRFALGLAIAIVIGIIIAGPYGLIVLAGVLSGIGVAFVSRKHFGGVGGDALGASNEIGRLVALLLWVIIL